MVLPAVCLLTQSELDWCRFGNFRSRCSVTDTNVQLSDVITDEEVSQDSSGVDSDCSTPIVHINSDILESESLRLLSETTFVDRLLTALPVCFSLLSYNHMNLLIYLSSISCISSTQPCTYYLHIIHCFLFRFYQRSSSMP